MLIRRAQALLLAPFIAGIAAAPVAAAQPPASATPAVEVSLSGKVQDVASDDFARGAAATTPYLIGDDGSATRLELPAGTSLRSGARATVHGTRKGSALAVAAGGISYATGSVTQQATLAAAQTKKVAVILVNFTDDTRTPWTAETIRSTMFDAAPVKSVNQFYIEQSYGAWTTTGDVLGWYTITGDRTACNWSSWGAAADAAAQAAGVTLSNYTNVIHVWPSQSTCGWAGLGYLPGRDTYINGSPSTYVMGHELGHNYGAHHASTRSCVDANSVRVTLSSSCTNSEYGDPFDIMGGAARLSQGWLRKLQGQLANADQQTVSTNGQYTLGVVESSTPAAPRITRIARGDGTYLYLEYRQPFGLFDNFGAADPVVNGVSIRIAPDASATQAYLLDMTPATSTYLDSALATGQSFTDPVSTVTISTLSVSSTGAVVDISWGPDTQAPSGVGTLNATPSSSGNVALSWSAATDNRVVAGYQVYRDSVLVTTVTGTTWTDTGRTPGSTYSYSVNAIDAAGNPGPASTKSVTIPLPDTQAPTAPTLSGTVSKTQVKLTWTAASDNVAVTGYRVYDGTKLIATLSASTRTYTVKNAKGAHTYTVRAIDAAGNESVASNGYVKAS